MTEIETSRCSGHCCMAFFCPVKPEQLAQLAETGKIQDGDREREILDGRFLGDMLIPLAATIGELPPAERALHESRGEAYMKDMAEGRENVISRGYYYTCRHYNRETGDCLAYEQRPRMCREYPYNKACEYPACTRTCQKPPEPEGELLKTAPEDKVKEAVV